MIRNLLLYEYGFKWVAISGIFGTVYECVQNVGVQLGYT